MKPRVLLAVGLVVAVAAVVLVLKLRRWDEASPPQPAVASRSDERAQLVDALSSDAPRLREVDPTRPADSYSIDLERLRPLIPENLYWQTGAPTSDVAVAKERARRAEERNKLLGRIQANEASEEEIRGYYSERRRVSNDYLQLAKLVLDGKAGEVSERDRGLFELTVNLHRGRLQQIERDQSDALGRLAARAARNGSGDSGASGGGVSGDASGGATGGAGVGSAGP